jgi:hypothetical protein
VDYDKLEKPVHLKDKIWRQHLNWLEVVGKQVEENLEKRKVQRAYFAAAGHAGHADDNAPV